MKIESLRYKNVHKMTNKIRWKTTLTDWFRGSGTEVVQSGSGTEVVRSGSGTEVRFLLESWWDKSEDDREKKMQLYNAPEQISLYKYLVLNINSLRYKI